MIKYASAMMQEWEEKSKALKKANNDLLIEKFLEMAIAKAVNDYGVVNTETAILSISDLEEIAKELLAD